MKHLDGLLNIADTEFAAVEANGKFRSKDEVEYVGELVDIVKDIYCIWQYEEEMEGGMSSAGGSYYRDGRGGGTSNRGGSYYEDGGSYYERRGRGRNASRDSRGRYNEGSYRDGNMMRRGSYYRDGGKEEFAENLREMMQEAPDENTRQSIQRMLSQMEQG